MMLRLAAYASGAVIAASLLLPPTIYWFVAYSDLSANLTADAHVFAELLDTAGTSSTGDSSLDQNALRELLSPHVEETLRKYNEQLSVFDAKGDRVAVAGVATEPPHIERTASILVDGAHAGEVRMARPLRPLLVNAAWLTLLGFLLAAASYVTLRLVPLRAALRASERLRQREASLDYANTLLTAAIEGALDAVLVVDQQYRIVTYNRHFLDLWRLPPELARSESDEAILAAGSKLLVDPVAFRERVRYLYAHPEESGRELIYLKDGRIIDRFTKTLYGPDHQNLGRIWFFRDVTERETAAERLRQSEERFKAIFENARDGIALADAKTRNFLIGNKSLCDMLGYSQDEFRTLNVVDIHPTEALEAVLEKFGHLSRGETHIAAGVPLKRKDGSVFYADINSATVNISGTSYTMGIFRDVTERMQADEAVRKSEEKYRNLVESTSDYIWEIDAQARYTYYSPAAVTHLGYAPNELIGKTPFDLMAPEEAARVREIFSPVVAEHAPFSLLENTVMRKDGTPVVMETSGVPVFDKDGNYRGYRGIERDITARKHAEVAVRQAEEALKQRDALLHAVTMGAAELLTAPSLDEGIRKSLENIGKTIQVDRVVVFERGPTDNPIPILRYAWHSSGTTVLPPDFFDNPSNRHPELLAWQAPLLEGKIIITHTSRATDAVRKMLTALGVESSLVVPITVDGKYWGQVGFDSSAKERKWADFEVEILRILSDLIGSAVQRDRYVKEIADANRIVQNTPTILFRVRGEPALPMIYISQNVALLGYEPAALIAAPEFYKSLIHPDNAEAVRNALERALRDHTPGVVEVRLLTSRGEYRWFENRFTPILDGADRIAEIEGLLFDITERKAAEERIAQLARTDALTGLANRSTFIERLRQVFVSARRGAKPFAVHYIDIDRFKDINDTLGHPLGDRLLAATAKRLKQAIREADTVARLGGDEFAVLQTDLDDASDAGALAAKLRSAAAEPLRIDGSDLRITVSIGIAIYAAAVATPEDMLARADVALYRAKEEGRDQYRFHTQELDVQVRDEVALAEELRSAVEKEQLKLYYQPQVELSSGRIVGMEALIRWDHPTRGVLSPSQFIEIAERSGTIGHIGQWVLDKACQQMRQWRDAGIAPQTIAVNISSAQIKSAAAFIQFVTDTLAKWNLDPSDLELDVTESMLARAALAQNDVIERLHALGIKISIDDFGTQYSSLDYLRTYRISRLKIPNTLTESAARNPESAAMVRAIVGIARELNIEVIAQGVENEQQWSFLTATSPTTKVQGYFYSAPVPADAADALLRQKVILPTHLAVKGR